MHAGAIAVDQAEAREQLERVLRSRVFGKAQRSQRFLRYVVEAALEEPARAVNEYAVAVDVFDREASYDSSVDATVRVEASRLRSRLREYYAEEGRDERLIIEVPKGAYAAVFSRKASTAVSLAAAGEDSDIRGNRAAAPAKQFWWWTGAAACLLAVLAAAAPIWIARHRARAQAMPSGAVSLAILPFSNKTGDASLDYLSQGLTDNLIRQLSNVRALRLVAHDSVFRFRNETQDARGVGRKLGVANVMTGELRRAGDHLVLDAELSSVQDGSVLSSREYAADGNDLRAAQGSVQIEVLSKLRMEGAARDPSRLGTLTSSAEAYREFLEGDFDARGGSPPELHAAIDHFEKAVSLDPKFELAWSALAARTYFWEFISSRRGCTCRWDGKMRSEPSRLTRGWAKRTAPWESSIWCTTGINRRRKRRWVWPARNRRRWER